MANKIEAGGNFLTGMPTFVSRPARDHLGRPRSQSKTGASARDCGPGNFRSLRELQKAIARDYSGRYRQSGRHHGYLVNSFEWKSPGLYRV
jgi:hypothetical protein